MTVGADRYLAGARRGDRLRPSLFSTRYHALRQLAGALREILGSDLVPPGDLLIDYGCAERPYESLCSAKFRTYVGVDLHGNRRADVAMAADGQLPFKTGVADCVLSTQVLEHLPRPELYLAEARRVLRPGGHLLLSTHGAWPYHPDPSDYRRWTLEGLRYELTVAGFRPIMERAVLGRVATTLQLLQDAVSAGLPRPARVVPGFVFQRLIGLTERLRRDPLPNDAAVYVILATRD